MSLSHVVTGTGILVVETYRTGLGPYEDGSIVRYGCKIISTPTDVVLPSILVLELVQPLYPVRGEIESDVTVISHLS